MYTPKMDAEAFETLDAGFETERLRIRAPRPRIRAPRLEDAPELNRAKLESFEGRLRDNEPAVDGSLGDTLVFSLLP